MVGEKQHKSRDVVGSDLSLGHLHVTMLVMTFPTSLFLTSLQGSTAPLTNLITYLLCFLTAYSSDVTSQPFSRERGGASD